jgi:streptogramin lyase
MLEGNFSVFSVLDAGYYGQGIYVTTDIDYAVTAYGRGKDGQIQDELHVVFCFVVIGNSCPVIECPFVGGQGRTAGLFGQPITPKSDSHLVVVASDPVGNASLGGARKDDYYPAPAEAWGHSVEVQGVGGMVPLVSRGFTEVAVRDESQMLPGGFMMIRPTAAKRVELEDAACKSMGSLGRLALAKGDKKKAMVYFDKAVELSSTRMRHVLLAERARLHSANGDDATAIADLQAALALQPEWYEGQVQLAEAYEGNGELGLALQTFQAVVRANNEVVMEYFEKMCVLAQRLADRVDELADRVDELESKYEAPIDWATATVMVSTAAGVAGSKGHVDGKGAAAKFNSPVGVSCTADGSMWVADRDNHCIRRIAADGKVSTVAGVAGSAGHVDGKGAVAKFNKPFSVSCAADGSVWLADRGNHCIRRIAADGMVSTVAGVSGSAGHVDGKGTAAKFNYPVGVSCAADGSVWVADQSNHCIRRIAADGTVTTVAGVVGSAGHVDGKGTAAKFSSSRGVSCAADGSVWVADQSNDCIRRIAADGTVSTVAGVVGSKGRVDGKGAAAKFSTPFGVSCAADGSLWVADFGNQCIRRISITP